MGLSTSEIVFLLDRASSRSHPKLGFPMVSPHFAQSNIWVCLKIGYIPNHSHLIGIMISKTIGFRGLAYFQTHPYILWLQVSGSQPLAPCLTWGRLVWCQVWSNLFCWGRVFLGLFELIFQWNIKDYMAIDGIFFDIFYDCSMIFIMECETLFMKAR